MSTATPVATSAAASINTAKVTGRRQLRFQRLDDIIVDIDRLQTSPNLRTLGNWRVDQILNHLARAMTKSIDGFDTRMPAPLRLLMRVLMKRRILNKGMTPGFNLPSKAAAEMHTPPASTAEAFANLRRAIERLHTETNRAPSPFLGRLTADEWNRLHCRHCELHLSFLIPEP
jgi:hypothetical protein